MDRVDLHRKSFRQSVVEKSLAASAGILGGWLEKRISAWKSPMRDEFSSA
jgi:hypothetical protein